MLLVFKALVFSFIFFLNSLLNGDLFKTVVKIIALIMHRTIISKFTANSFISCTIITVPMLLVAVIVPVTNSTLLNILPLAISLTDICCAVVCPNAMFVVISVVVTTLFFVSVFAIKVDRKSVV